MAPMCNNYGTFVAPAGYCAVEPWREGDHIPDAYQLENPFPERKPVPSAAGCDFIITRNVDGDFPLQLIRNGADVIVSGVEDVRARDDGLCKGDVVTHLDGRPLLGSLKTANLCIEEAGESLTVRARSVHDGPRHGTSYRGKSKDHVVQHVVCQGDSVESLAASYRVTTDQVRVWNRKHFPVGEPGFLFPGQVLTLRTSGRKNIRSEAKATTDGRRRRSEGDRGRRRMLYEVRSGDSLKAISARLNVKEDEVRRLNRSVFPIGEAGALIPGQMLTIFAAQGQGLREGESLPRPTSLQGDEGRFAHRLGSRKTRSSMGVGIRVAGILG